MQTIELNKKVASIEVADDKIIINLEQKYIPKDGEYFYVETKANTKFIGIKKEGEHITSRYCSYGIKHSTINSGKDSYITANEWIKVIRPATKTEIELLDKVLQDNGLKWNPETKRVEALPRVGDFCIFWDDDKSTARCGILLEVAFGGLPYAINYDVSFKNCIPFQSIEHYKEFIKE